MKCLYPVGISSNNKISKRTGGSNAAFFVPCGKCTYCKIRRRREWVNRMICQLDTSEESSFITLTYNDENLPNGASLEKRDLVLFFKRFRKILGNWRRIKYYACGEYGELCGNCGAAGIFCNCGKFIPVLGRPHYHFILFGFKKTDFINLVIEAAWHQGFVRVDNNSPETMQYVAQYVDKKKYGDLSLKELDGREPLFQLQSQGIGREYLRKNIDRLMKDNYLQINEFKVSLPRYFLKKLREYDPIWYESFIEQSKQRQREKIKELIGTEGKLYSELSQQDKDQFMSIMLKQAEAVDIDLKTRLKMFKRKEKI